ncbi:MAG TPA: hypothetical protein VMG12_00745 [Polyangiaceae bacterium]|nr:hypothetical protein [Polyangiaceae bacterium]
MTSVIAALKPAYALFPRRVTRFVAPLLIALPLPVLGACGQKANAEPLPPLMETATSELKVQPADEGAAAALQTEDAELRRGYGVVDMRYEPCVIARGDQALQGEGCASGFLIYGPYVNVPAKSEVEITFDIQPTQRVEVYADIVSQMGKQALAGLNPQTIEAGVNQRLGYRVHIAKADQFVESRIGMRAATPVQFSITNYTMTVR